MGYTHYWYRRTKRVDKRVFGAIIDDFKKLMPELDRAGVPLAGGDGTSEPEFTANLVSFNGVHDCGHPANHEMAIPWPTADAGGVVNPWREDAKSGVWHSGAEVRKRCCNGHCDYESFSFERCLDKDAFRATGGGWFNCCKTAFRPYDLAVICFLILAKRHLEEDVKVKSDGTDDQWFDGKLFCQMHLGFGMEYAFGRDGTLTATELVSRRAPREESE